jgi:hypothetical protein
VSDAPEVIGVVGAGIARLAAAIIVHALDALRMERYRAAPLLRRMATYHGLGA